MATRAVATQLIDEIDLLSAQLFGCRQARSEAEQRISQLESLLREAQAFCPMAREGEQPMLGDKIEQVLSTQKEGTT